jgi:hypothetical protein
MMSVTGVFGSAFCTQLHTYRFILGSNTQRGVPVLNRGVPFEFYGKGSRQWAVGSGSPDKFLFNAMLFGF